MSKKINLALAITALAFLPGVTFAELDIHNEPLFVGVSIPPTVMLNMSSDNQLFFNAYPEYADLTGNGEPELGYNHEFDYYGYFDSLKCYDYDVAGNHFSPQSITTNKYCDGVSGDWSGNFLNWLTMARIDTVRKILYGGFRSVDTEEKTILERTYLPNDAHSWVRFYNKPDLNRLSPFESGEPTVSISTSDHSVVGGSLGNNGDRLWFTVPQWDNELIQTGDQVKITNEDDEDVWMVGVIVEIDTGSPRRVRVQVTDSENPNGLGENDEWVLTNYSRAGVSFCNTTVSGTASSHEVTDPPLLTVARGDYSLWTAAERWQCRWREDENTNALSIGGQNFSNGNHYSASGLWANAENPRRNNVRLGDRDFQARVEVCKPDLVGEERCQEYGDDDDELILKPIGLLQEFSGTGALQFGLMTGSYTNHVDGGVLRKNISSFADEVNPDTGQFTYPTDSIVRTIDRLRIYGYSHNNGTYDRNAENCPFGTTKNQMINGRCFSWGNPQAEILAESLRYLAGLEPNNDFNVSGTDRISGLTSADWDNPITEERWCTPTSVIQFNASVTSYDDGAPAAASGLPGIGSLDTWTAGVGAGEGINGSEVFVGGDQGFCSSSTLSSLAGFKGICPEAPNQDGTYHIAGLANYAYLTDLRPDWLGEQTVDTIGVSLAPAVPRIAIPKPGETEAAVVILPACDNRGENSRCALVDFRIVDQDIEEGTGEFFVQWDVAEWGADFDSDLNGNIRYEITDDAVEVTTEVWAQSSGRSTGFGYIISGTTQDGFHAHSGINGYTRAAATLGAPSCNNCARNDPPTSHEFEIGDSTAELLREPLYYAAKWGGFDKDRNFPSDPTSWDKDGDGEPDNYFFAVNPADLFNALRRAFQRVLDAVETTTLETTSSRLETGTLVYQAGFDTTTWSGDILAIDPLETGPNRTKWIASEKLADLGWDDRDVYTSTADGAVRFDTDLEESSPAILALMAEVGALVSTLECDGAEDESYLCDLDAETLIEYLLGNHESERRNGGTLRDRDGMVGDIVNSQIVLSAQRNEGWFRLAEDQGGGVTEPGSYGDFLDEVKADRPSTVFVGSNNGMLHAFDADSGVERFAYIPSMVHDKLFKLADPSYAHEFYVDGRLSIGDAYLTVDGSTEWRTILVGSLGAGGEGVFALDVTDPSEGFDETNVLWEFNPGSDDGSSIGHVFAPPTITRLEDGTWVTIVGNGFNSEVGEPSLLVIDLETGELLDSAEPDLNSAEAEEANGLAGPAIWLNAGTRIYADRVYAGDLSGRMWRFDFEDSSLSDPSLLFNAGSGKPISSAPNLAANVRGGLDVFFGTGKLIEVVDVEIDDDFPVQTFYVVRDKDGSNPINPDDLGEVSITERSGGARSVEVISQDDGGWKIDLVTASSGRGERLLVRPEVTFGRIIFATFQPSDKICDGGGVSRLYVLDVASGGGGLDFVDDDDCPGCGAVTIPDSSAPLNPPVVIVSPPIEGPGDDDDPINPGQPGGDDDDPLPPVPDGDGLDRSAWCSQYGFLNPSNQQFVPLGNVCDGRQTWRQIL